MKTTSAKEIADLGLIKTLFFRRKEKVGSRQIKMMLLREFGVVMNLKKITRLKNKYGLVTKIRRKRKASLVAKSMREHKVCGNILNREFAQTSADKVYSTDITELRYGSSSRAYLAVFKDLATNEIVSSELTKIPTAEFVNRALATAVDKLSRTQLQQLMIHSDQGIQFTHYGYRQILERNEITQSMSRRGNCLDNSPVESFFGHFKDHLESESCATFDELETRVKTEINYYNNERPQLRLKKMPPSEYRRHLELCC